MERGYPVMLVGGAGSGKFDNLLSDMLIVFFIKLNNYRKNCYC